MQATILQYGSTEQQQLLDLSAPINKKYADKFGFKHLVDGTRRCPERNIFWEKISYLQAILPTLEDGSLVVWVDADSLCIGNEDLHNVLPSNGIFGMVQLRGGLGGKKLLNWYNSGFLAMINSPEIRDFFDRVWARNTPTDEDALNAELKHNALVVYDGKTISGLDIKWNCWKNNIALCKNPVIRSFHGMTFPNKLTEITAYLKSNKL